MSETPRAVIFDMDGVLVASGPAHAASWRLVARRHGIDVSEQRFRESFGRTSRDIIATLWGAGLAPDDVERIDADKERTYRELISGVVPLMIGARETLAALAAAGYRLAVASSGPRENIDLVLDETRIRGSFSAVVTGFDVCRGKPDPECFLLAARRLGVPPPGCVVVEDAPVGIEAALAAKMGVIGLAGTHPAHRLATAGAHRVVAALREITPALVGQVLAST
ncbi:MAG: HAD family phosphatase [Phycisphaerae bacterium]|jgi:beta-phosphoglucomutase|nr:HAD family phosphatase [Phycisphaerae bacterium]MCZ2398510.1 HAD family phosphatase [Phycisphaerae bacterium]